MKIALIVPGFSSNERDWCIPALLDYVRVLAGRAEVHVFTLRWPERRETYPVFGATVHALGGRQHLGIRVLSLWARALRAIALEHRCAPVTVLHAFWADEPGWVAAWAGAQLGVPVIVSLAGGELVGLRNIGYGLQLLPARGPMIRWALRRAARVTAGSDYLLRLAWAYLPQAQWAKLVRAPLGVDTELFSPPLSRPPAIAREREAGVGVGVGALNAGALYPVKDQAALLRVLARVPGAHLQIAGQGPLRAYLQDLALRLGVAERVEFLGEVDHGCLPDVYRGADVYVQTSRHESQGMALLEAAACGLPVVGTPVGVLPEIGLVARDEAELVQTLGDLLGDEPRRRVLGEAARAKVQAVFSPNVAVERFMNLYSSPDPGEKSGTRTAQSITGDTEVERSLRRP